jgi:hypothetical protein
LVEVEEFIDLLRNTAFSRKSAQQVPLCYHLQQLARTGLTVIKANGAEFLASQRTIFRNAAKGKKLQ